MTDLRFEVAQKIVGFRRVFAHHPAFLRLEEQFRLLLERRRAELAADISLEARGIAVIGASGSGKTSAVARLLSHTPGLVIHDDGSARADVVSFQVPSPATLKFVGQTALEATGYPMFARRTEMVIWAMVRQHLFARRTLFLHLDEAQDLLRHQTPSALQSVVRTLKSLMQAKDWPVGLILSGTPELKDLLNHDPQLARRFYPIEFPKLFATADATRVMETISAYASRVNLSVSSNLNDDFSARLIHASDGEFGLLIEIVISAAEEALLARKDHLDHLHFIMAFRRRSGCIDALNPFIAVDFLRIDARTLLAKEISR